MKRGGEAANALARKCIDRVPWMNSRIPWTPGLNPCFSQLSSMVYGALCRVIAVLPPSMDEALGARGLSRTDDARTEASSASHGWVETILETAWPRRVDVLVNAALNDIADVRKQPTGMIPVRLTQ